MNTGYTTLAWTSLYSQLVNCQASPEVDSAGRNRFVELKKCLAAWVDQNPVVKKHLMKKTPAVTAEHHHGANGDSSGGVHVNGGDGITGTGPNRLQTVADLVRFYFSLNTKNKLDAWYLPSLIFNKKAIFHRKGADHLKHRLLGSRGNKSEEHKRRMKETNEVLMKTLELHRDNRGRWEAGNHHNLIKLAHYYCIDYHDLLKTGLPRQQLSLAIESKEEDSLPPVTQPEPMNERPEPASAQPVSSSAQHVTTSVQHVPTNVQLGLSQVQLEPTRLNVQTQPTHRRLKWVPVPQKAKIPVTSPRYAGRSETY